MNVLIVDDSAPWAELCAVLLRKVADKVRIAHTFAEAQATIKLPNGFDVVMLDLDLPDSPPNFTIERIEAIRGTGRKVVVMTGQDVTEDLRARMKAHGAMGCLYKGSLGIAEELQAACL